MAKIDDLERGLVDQYGVAVKAELTEDGKEVGDPTPLAPPAHLRRSMTMAEQIQQMVRREISLRAEDAGFESFEEAEDFEVDDDPPDPHTPYEAVFDPPPPVVENEDGKRPVDKGRTKPAERGSGKSGKVGKNDAGSVENADDEGGSGQASDGDTGAESKD